MLFQGSLYIFLPAFLSLFLYRYLIFPFYLSPLSRIPPAHCTSPISALWIRWHRRGGRTGFRLLLAAHKKLGPVIRLSPNELSVASLDGLRKIYLGGFEKTEWYMEEFMNYQTPNLVSMLGSKEHSAQKRMLSHVYSKSYIQNSLDLRRSSHVILCRWVDLLSQFLEADQKKRPQEVIIPPLQWNKALGADFTSAYLFGLENGSNFLGDWEVARKYSENWEIKMKGLIGKEKATQEIEKYVMRLVQRTEWSIQNPKENHLSVKVESRPVVYEQLSKGLEKSGSKSLEEREFILASEMLDHFIAGLETAKITLTYLQWELSRRPELQSALRHELLGLSPPFKFSPSKSQAQDRQQLPDPKALDALPTLDAILKETLRLYPPSPSLLTRIVPPGGIVIEGHEIPGGVVVGTSGYVMHMNEDVFPDAMSFKSERWFVESAQKAEMMRWFWVFGSGGRMCVGSHFAIYSKSLISWVRGNNGLNL